MVNYNMFMSFMFYIKIKYMFLSLYQSKPTAKKWLATPIPNYFKMAQLWAKDRATKVMEKCFMKIGIGP